jgi:hypothetical protein
MPGARFLTLHTLLYGSTIAAIPYGRLPLSRGQTPHVVIEGHATPSATNTLYSLNSHHSVQAHATVGPPSLASPSRSPSIR